MNDINLWRKRLRGIKTDGFIGKCHNCGNNMYEDCESFIDDEDNMYCCEECVFEEFNITVNR